MNNLSKIMSEHHDKMNRFFREYKEFDEKNDETSFQKFDQFAKHLLLHINIEERYIFPIYESRFTGTSSVTPTLRHDHYQIKVCMSMIKKAIKEKSNRLDELNDDFEKILRVHNATEEYAVYNWIDDILRSS